MDFNDNSSKKPTVCPSDRQLALRAKLQTGWSSTCKRVALNAEEQDAIVQVIKRNEQLENAERQRVGKLVERIERIKARGSTYYGPKNCSLCGQSFGFGILLNMTHKQTCLDCKKPVCSHCCVEISASSPTKKSVWLCHICSEIRDVWKKTGAWFYKGLPNYELPKVENRGKSETFDQPKRQIRTTKLGMELESDEDEEDSVDGVKDDSKSTRNGSFTSSLLKSKNLFNLRLTSASATGSRLNLEEFSSTFTKKSPVSPYSRQTSSSDSQKSAHSLQAPDWEAATVNGTGRQRKNSVSSNYSTTESSAGIDSFNMKAKNFREPIVLGWLEISLNFDESQDTLHCTILRARDLPSMDQQGLADPFCKVNIITAEDSLRHSRWQKTRIVHKTNNPEFNEKLVFIGLASDELNGSSLCIVLLDDDKYGNDFLGATKIPLGSILNCSPCRMTIPLGPEDKFSIEALSLSGGSHNGQILIALCYNTQKRALSVVIKRCINLLAMDKNGLSDPFVKIQLRPDSNKKKYKTSIKWRNLNPVFNEEFFFETRPHDLDKQSLIITVWDKDIGKSNDFLGSLILGQCSKGRRLKQWKDCIIVPDQYHEQWHFLSNDLPHHH